MPQIVTGLQRLLQDITVWLLFLIPPGAAIMIAYHVLKKMLSDGDPVVIADRNRKIKQVLISAAIGTIAAAIGIITSRILWI